MKSGVYDVTLYWHDGGSLFLGTVAAMSAGDAQAVAMRQYVAQSKVNRLEIEDGGSYQLSAEPLTPDKAAAWRQKKA